MPHNASEARLLAPTFFCCYPAGMRKKQTITEAEWPILETLWDVETATAADIFKAVSARRDVTEKTVKSLTRRLIAKQMVDFTVDPADARIYHYRAVASREACLKEKADSMVSLLYGGRIRDLFEHFVNDLKPEEITHVERLLAQKKQENPDDA